MKANQSSCEPDSTSTQTARYHQPIRVSNQEKRFQIQTKIQIPSKIPKLIEFVPSFVFLFIFVFVSTFFCQLLKWQCQSVAGCHIYFAETNLASAGCHEPQQNFSQIFTTAACKYKWQYSKKYKYN